MTLARNLEFFLNQFFLLTPGVIEPHELFKSLDSHNDMTTIPRSVIAISALGFCADINDRKG